MKKILTGILAFFDQIVNTLTLRYRRVQCKGRPIIHGRLCIFGNGEIVLGKNVTINSSAASNPIGGDTKTVFSIVPGASLRIGDGVGISNSAIVCHKKVAIGRGTVIGGSVKIYDTDFHDLTDGRRSVDDREAAAKKAVVIGEKAFIGAHSIILKGVTIGNGAVVGAGSVVAADIPAGETWAGNPARKIR